VFNFSLRVSLNMILFYAIISILIGRVNGFFIPCESQKEEFSDIVRECTPVFNKINWFGRLHTPSCIDIHTNDESYLLPITC